LEKAWNYRGLRLARPRGSPRAGLASGLGRCRSPHRRGRPPPPMSPWKAADHATRDHRFDRVARDGLGSGHPSLSTGTQVDGISYELGCSCVVPATTPRSLMAIPLLL